MRREPDLASQAGYTLVELLVVLAIIGLLVGVALPMIAGTRPALEAKATARAVAENLSAARQIAINSGTMQRVVLQRATRKLITMPAGTALLVPGTAALSLAKGSEIDFFPDGSTNGGEVTITAGKSKHSVSVRWPTGQIFSDD